MNLKDWLFTSKQGQEKEKIEQQQSISQHLESQKAIHSVEQRELQYKCPLTGTMIRDKLSHLTGHRKLSEFGQPNEEDGNNLRLYSVV